MQEHEGNHEVTPQRILDTAFAFTSTSILVAGVNLEVFTHISKGHNTATNIADAARSSVRGTQMLLNSLASLDFLTKSDGVDATYHLTPISDAFLVKDKPSYFGDFVLHAEALWSPWGNLTEPVMHNIPLKQVEGNDGPEFFEKFVPQLFPLSYPAASGAAAALGVGDTWNNLNILDVAAGSGAWSIAFAQRDPGTKVTVQDWPPVLEVTKKFVSKFNLTKQFSYLPGDLREADFGEEQYDLIILGHLCHKESAKKTRELFSLCHNALKKGGKLLIADMIPDEGRKTEYFPLMFALNMLINTAEGDTFTMSEYRQWLQNADFHDVEIIDAPGPSPLIVAKK